MIVLLAASAITLTALQASINAPRDAFKACLKEATTKAADEKVHADAYEAYVRDACSAKLGAFKTATVNFDMKNKMSRKDATEDADLMIADFLGSAIDHYQYVLKGMAPQEAAKAAPAAATPADVTTPPPTPASAPQPPKP